MILDKIKTYGFQSLCLVLGALLILQTWRLHTEQIGHERLKTQMAETAAERTGAALKEEQTTGKKEAAHAASTQENSDEFTLSQPVRDAIYRADLAVAERLRRGAESRAATYRAQADANAAACLNLANRLEALDAHVVRGAEVVTGLRADLVRRDAEVVLLRKQVDTERSLNAE